MQSQIPAGKGRLCGNHCRYWRARLEPGLQRPTYLILLDIGLPDQDGLEIARTLQHELNTPIIFLTGRRQENDIVLGLELGAEDYVTKSFGMRELLARIRVVLRRATREPAPPATDDSVLWFVIGGCRYAA